MRSLALLLLALAAPVVAQPTPDASPFRATADRIIDAALADSTAYVRLAEMADAFGHRLSGSQALEDAIDWMLEMMEADGLDNVRGEPVMVPHWVRGEESVTLIEPRRERLAMLGIGNSVGTPEGGVTAEVLVVGSFDELARRADEVPGKIVLFNVPFTTYGQTVPYRTRGANEAARYGAVASLVRSVGPVSLQTPHTGTLVYDDDLPRIPHAALTIEGAEMLQRMQDRGDRVVVNLDMEAEMLPDALSHNVVAELRGRETPEEIVVIGGHIDSWDVGQGVVDDAGGVVASWEAVRLLKELGLRPRRTIRVVGWTNEENGLRGGRAYRDAHLDELDDHVLAVETDGGVFTPVSFGVTASDEAFAMLDPLNELLAPVMAATEARTETGITRGGGGADIGPIMAEGVPGAGLSVDGSTYFWVHHTEADTMDKIDVRELQRCVAALAVLAYYVAELPERLPR
ncbi:MAG: M28 family metallopeptidase [Rhodothermales bacterium]